jgi:hypothetical protein
MFKSLPTLLAACCAVLSLHAQTWQTDSLAVRAILDANGQQSVSVGGVTIRGGSDGRIVTLSLRDPDYFIIDTLPPVVGQLTALKQCYIYTNHLTALPDEIGNLVNLEALIANYNYLTEIPASIGNLTKLKQLDLEGNFITDLPETLMSITTWQAVAGVMLAGNQLCDTTVFTLPFIAWLDQKCPAWRITQDCPTAVRGQTRPAQAPVCGWVDDGLQLTITGYTAQSGLVALYDMTGARCAAVPMVAGRAVLDTRHLANGIYLLQGPGTGAVRFMHVGR